MTDPSTPPTPIDVPTVRTSMRLSTVEGIFAVQYISLTTATLLIGFLLALGASAFQVGLAAAFPLLGGLLQPIGAEIIRRRGGWRKDVLVGSVLIDELLWLVSIAAVLILPPSRALLVVLVVLGIQQLAVQTSALAWNSLISMLIPREVRGRYFGKRNFVVNALGAITAVLAGQFIERIGHDEAWSYTIAIGFGILMRFASAYVLNRHPEPVPTAEVDKPFLDRFKDPLRHTAYRRYLRFLLGWEFAAQMAAPFFIVYMIRELRIDFSTVVIFAGVATLANLISQQFWGRLCDRFGNREVLAVVCLVLAFEPVAFLFTNAETTGLILIGVIHLVAGSANGGYLLANGNLMMGLSPISGQTSYFAMQAAVKGGAAAAGPLIGGALIEYVFGPLIPVPALLGTGFGLLFVIAFVFRALGWIGLRTVSEPVEKPRLHPSILLSEFGRTFNVTQGFSLLPQFFAIDPDLDDETIEEAIRASR